MIEEKAAFLRSAFFFHLDDLPSTEGETHLQILTHLIFKDWAVPRNVITWIQVHICSY